MTTGLQIALLGGALVGLGIALLVWRLTPARPDLADVIHRYSPEGVRGRIATESATTSVTNSTERLGVWALRRLPASWWGKTPTKELALLRIPLHRHYGSKVVFALLGLLIPPILGYACSVAGFPLPVLIPTAGSIALAVGLWFLPDYNVRDDARKARVEFGRALGAYTDLVALERLGGSGTRQAMELAAEVGDNWVFRRLSEELARSRWSGLAPWDAMHVLADELGLPELDDLADIMRLSKEGSQVYAQLRARSEGLRSAMLNAALGKSNAAGERMTIPMALLSIMFLVILITPSLLRLMGGE
ncbi:type II secretion system protein (plasmid) [Xylanimonas cellulosilytica DSM 15894]|uniref:Type II secretion system protein n=1 Tax=Xylanimonas cellulosilytica (strain DSM 15894 / JCM 12276 / CECT 5975 / KCTC 9989 / LMG 20990 / NBRC 107835 / XIL07) TaxID=446471 RepID=D1C0V4_XYLCX|nr:type II secretion system F family protein [Xylanimonas cellulosilytica]ACZ32420.1 type II secretion system protein [Xylanimonas cellulosilytica DSM 15894]